MKYTKSAIGLLTSQYRSVLKKCFLINLGLYALGAVAATPAMAETIESRQVITSPTTFSDATATGIVSPDVNGGVISNNGSNVTLNGTSTFTSNKATGPDDWDNNALGAGGVIYNSGTLTVGGTFGGENAADGNTALQGGAIFNEGGDLTVLANSVFENNKATGATNGSFGGAIFNDHPNSKVTIGNGTKFIGNTAASGAAIYSEGLTEAQNTVTIGDNVQFLNNVSNNTDGSSAAIYLFGNNKMTIGENALFKGNTGSYAGASIFMIDGAPLDSPNGLATATIGDGATFEENTAGYAGSAVYLNTKGNTLSIGDNATFENNTGNAVWTGGALTIGENATFTGNTATAAGALQNGGAIVVRNNGDVLDGSVTIGTGATFTNNTAGNLGGAIYNEGSTTINGSATFSGNKANGADNDIYNTGTLNLATASGKTISLAGGIDGNAENKGTVNITGAGTVETSTIKNQTVDVTSGELALSKADLTGSTVNVASDAIINTIDNIINDYSSNINLASGALIKGDIDFEHGTADSYAATGTVKYKLGNLIGAAASGTKEIQVASAGSTVDISQALWTSDNGMTFLSSGTNDGKIKVEGFAGGIDDAADASANVEVVDYEMTADESLDADKTLSNKFNLTGQGTDATDPALTLNANLATTSGADVSITNAKLEGTGTFQNVAGATTTILNSNIDVDVNNAGILISDPTTYSGVVSNTGIATFDADTFTGTAELANNGDAYLSNGVTFQNGATITGIGDLTLTNGTTQFNDTVVENDVYVDDTGNFTGTLTGTSSDHFTLDTSNHNIDSITGSAQYADLYIDAKLGTTNTIDHFSGDNSNSTVKEITVLGMDYGTADKVDLTIGAGVALDSNVVINGANYYTDYDYNSTTGVLTLKDKLINTTTIQGTGNGTDSWTGNVVIGSKADNTTIGTPNAKIALDESDKQVNITATSGVIVSDGTNSTTLKSTATGLNIDDPLTVGTKGTKLTDSSLVISNGTAAQDATLTTTATGLNVDKGLTVATDKFTVNTSGDVTAAGSMDIAGGLKAGASDAFTVNTSGAIAKVAGITSQDAINVESAGKTIVQASSAGLKVGTDVTAGTPVVNFSVDASGNTTVGGITKLSETNGLQFGASGQNVTKIDNDGTYVSTAATAATTLATGATVYAGAGKASYNNGAAGTNIAAGATINSAVGALDTAIGNLSATGLPTGTTVSDKLKSAQTEIDTTQASLGVLNTDGSYNAAALTNNMYKDTSGTAATTLAGALNNMAGNVTAITGGSINASGAVVNNYTAGMTSVNYAALSNGTTPLATAIGQLNKNIGTAVTSTNYVATSNTVNANISALDTQLKNTATMIGADPTTMTAGGALNGVVIGHDSSAGQVSITTAIDMLSKDFTNGDIDARFKTVAIGNDDVTDTNNIHLGQNATNKSLTVDKGLELNGNLKVGSANAISSTVASTLDMGANALTNVKGLTLTDNAAGTPNTIAMTVEQATIGSAAQTVMKVSGNELVDGHLASTNGISVLSAGSTPGTYTETFVADADKIQYVNTSGNTTFKVNSDTGNIQTAGNITIGTDTTAANNITLSQNATTKNLEINHGIDVTGNSTVKGTLSVLNGTSSSVFSVDQNGSITSDGLKTVATGTKTAELGGAGYTTSLKGTTVNVGDNTNTTTTNVAGTTVNVGGASTTTTNVAGTTVNVGGASTTTATLKAGSNGVTADATGTKIAYGTTNSVYVGSAGTVVTGDESVSGALTADGETKLGKFTSTSGTGYALDVKSNAVTANQVVEAKSGVKFGTDAIAMTSVNQTAISSVANDATNQTALVSAKSLQQTRLAMTNENTSVFGGVYDYNTSSGVVSYNASALSNNAYKASSAAGNLTTSLNNLANNVEAATGGTFAANGSWSANVSTGSGVDYAYSATSTSLMNAVNQVASNIGTFASSSTSGNINQANSVNSNVASLDSAIGDRSTMTNTGTVNYTASALTSKDISTALTQVASNVGTAVTTTKGNVLATNTVNKNLELIDTNIGNISVFASSATGNLKNDVPSATTPNASDVATAVINLDKTLGQIHGLRAKLEGAGGTTATSAGSNLQTGTTVEDHLTTLDAAIGNRTAIGSLNSDINTKTATSVAQGLKATGDAIGDMDFSSAHYYKQPAGSSNLSDAVRTLDSNLYRVDHELRDLRHDFNAGMASMAAMSALVPNPRAAGDTSLSLGTGAYSGHTAVAFGGFHYLTDNVLLNAGAAWGNTNDVSYRLGVTWSW